jgi:hypothetical protein
MRTTWPALVFLLVLNSACNDHDPPPLPSSGIPGMSHILLSVDSACVQGPNVVTPNSDGVNDGFHLLAKHVTLLQTLIIAPDGSVAFSSNSLWPSWEGLDSTDPGRYRVQVHAITTSGIELSGWSYLDLMTYDASMCLEHNGTPVTGDQFDPRICGVNYPTQDIFCP